MIVIWNRVGVWWLWVWVEQLRCLGVDNEGF